MRVAQVERFGGPEVLVPAELPDPVAGPDEVVIAVDHIDTLFVQTQIRAGAFGEYFDVAPPYVPAAASPARSSRPARRSTRRCGRAAG
ncbi:hypothetical protein [Streptomyces melanogenes]|uniref:Uncharacterized protein n=1 Tax=Streptomyces melanogenes TaxID=67326 RepID=A0ABZ1XKH3_9ACTN|nr:hypothetical protein [Streptomyces melanogenes]